MDTFRRNNDGFVTVDLSGRQHGARLQLTDDILLVQKEDLAYTYSPTDHVDSAILARERVVHLRREKVGGLGLSVKGGAEHNLPILVSRIFKEQAADKTGQLFVGDAILEVNGTNIEAYRHDDAVTSLKNAGEDVKLTVKYFHPASLFLNKGNNKSTRDEENNQLNGLAFNGHNGMDIENNPELQPERQWSDLAGVPLLFAHVSQYLPGSDEIRSLGFVTTGLENETSGTILCDDLQSQEDWIQTINSNILAVNAQSITLTNKLLLPAEQISHMCWVSERLGVSKLSQAWRRKFVAFKGPDVCIFESPPVTSRDWLKCEQDYKIYECMFKVLKDGDLVDRRLYCFTLEAGEGGRCHYMSVESRQQLLRLEKCWYRATYQAVKHLGSKTFGCTWRGRISGLTLDLSVGFSLYESESKSYMWSYRFSQLKGSSDDGHTKLTLAFLGDDNQMETREIECTELQTLLFSMHAFLSAKLASVDPTFLFNL